MLDTQAPRIHRRPPPLVDDAAARLGRMFVDAVVAADFDRLEALLAPEVRFRAITPRRFVEASTAACARAIVEGWFGDTEGRTLVGRTVGRVGDRLVVGYRIELVEAGERLVVEQHVAAAVDGETLGDVSVLCSGFRPLPAEREAEPAAGAHAPAGEERPSAGEDETVDPPAFAIPPATTPAALLDATGLSCATLTPTISATVRGLEAGAVLEILTDDPAAEADLRSWARLTGNELIAAAAGPGQALRYGIRRTPRRAAPVDNGGTA